MCGILLTYVVLVITVCSVQEPEPGSDERPIISKEFWGDWVVLAKDGATGRIEYFEYILQPYETILKITANTMNGKAIGVSGDFYSNPRKEYVGVKFEQLSSIHPNLLYCEYYRYWRSGYVQMKVYLFPKYSKSSSFTGSIVGFDNMPQSQVHILPSRAVSGIGGMQVIINNLNKPGQTTTTNTDSNGNFTANDIVPGDTYEVSVGDQIIQFTPIADGDNIGTITITDGVNFKTSYSGSDSKRYINRNYSVTIYMKNTGTVRASGTNYKITLDAGLTSVTGTSILSGIMGTVDSGQTGYIQLTLNCNSIQGEYEWKKLFIEINDPINNKTWNDSVSILFHSSSVSVMLYPRYYTPGNVGKPTSNFSFAVISPDGENFVSKSPWASNREELEIPLLSGEYLIIVQGREMVYELCDNINGRSGENASQFTDTGRYKPNQSAAQARVVQLPIMAYMIKDTFDFYKVKYK